MMDKEDRPKRPGFMLYFDMFLLIENLPDASCFRRFVCAMAEYARDGVIPEFEDDGSKTIWPLIRSKLDADNAAYLKKRNQTRNAANSRWGNENNAELCERIETDSYADRERNRDRDTTRDTTTAQRDGVCPCTLDEVESYVREKNYSVSPEKFIKYFDDKGWSGVTDWKKRLDSWEKRELNIKPSSQPGQYELDAVKRQNQVATL